MYLLQDCLLTYLKFTGHRCILFLLPDQLHDLHLMMHRPKELSKCIFCIDLQAGCVDAGMASEKLPFQNIFIHKELYSVIPVIHKAQNTGGPRRAVQHLLHLSG